MLSPKNPASKPTRWLPDVVWAVQSGAWRPGLRRIFSLIAGVLLLAGCSKRGDGAGTAEAESRDPIIAVENDDVEMEVAIAEARVTLPEFWAVMEKPEGGESDFAVKVKIADENGVEHFWVGELERVDGKTRGTVNNEPITVKSVKFGERIEIPEEDITDWTYTREGKMVGNRTLRAMFKQMAPEEVERFKALMVEP